MMDSHDRVSGVALRLEDDSVELGHDETTELNNSAEREGESQDDCPDLIVSAGQVQRHIGKPVDGGHRVGKKDELGFVEAPGTFSCLEGVQCCQHNQEERVDQACHDGGVQSTAHQDLFARGSFWRDHMSDLGRLHKQPNDQNNQLNGNKAQHN